MTKKEKLIYEAEQKYQEAKKRRIAEENYQRKKKELDKKLEELESETAKAHIKINKEKNKK